MLKRSNFVEREFLVIEDFSETFSEKSNNNIINAGWHFSPLLVMAKDLLMRLEELLKEKPPEQVFNDHTETKS